MPEDSAGGDERKIRSSDEVARRCVILYAVIVAGHDEPRGELVEWLRREGLWDAVTPRESNFLRTDSPTQQQRFDATWRAEALFPLLWSLSLITELQSPTQLCDLQQIRSVLPPLFGSVTDFLLSSELRRDDDIFDANEDIYQIHWKVRDARLNGRPVPDNFNAGVVQERHHALNWLIGYCEQQWDDISTDT